MIFIIGGKGLVGSAIVRYLEKNKLHYKNIQRENRQDFFGKSCDVLIYANGNAYKYKAIEDPHFDFIASVTSVAEYIHNIKFKKFILISTVDVYSDTSSLKNTYESVEIDEDKLNNYGYHKLLAENYVRHFCENYLIFRLSGLVGKGLKKNPIYDFIHKDKKVMISKKSKMNIINTEYVAQIIFKIINLNINNETFNLASENSIYIKDLKKILNFDSEYTQKSEKYLQNYKINVNKIKKNITLSRSEDAISEYFKSILINKI